MNAFKKLGRRNIRFLLQVLAVILLITAAVAANAEQRVSSFSISTTLTH